MYRVLIGAACSLLLLIVTACASRLPSYRPDVRQGNYIDQTLVDQLRTGMSKQQVQFLLGTPLLDDPFRQDRWDYVYRFRPGRREAEQRRLTLFFTGDALARIDKGGDWPSAQP